MGIDVVANSQMLGNLAVRKKRKSTKSSMAKFMYCGLDQRDCLPERERLFPEFGTISCDLREYRDCKELGQPWKNRVKKQEPHGHMLAMPFKALLRGERSLYKGLWVDKPSPVEMDANGDTQ